MNATNNTILITGGTSGIGLELGKAFLKKGNKVILLGRNEKKLEQLKTRGFETIKCDLQNKNEIETAVLEIQNRYPDLNILFNNAGIQHNYQFTDTVIPLDRIKEEIEINVTGQIILSQLLIPVLSNKNNACIINTTSGLAFFPKSDGLVYSASKAALQNFTKGLKYALRKTGISVIEFIPPVTDTGMTSNRNEKKMPADILVQKVMPQILRERPVATISSIRILRWIAFFAPNLSNRILSK
ncbi:MAG TPA: SDR family NAD(P)-dependent oxidoreductase [Bacteroidales bacterium]|nr:SDR family NAD(P)-dependent oxidoreductase [Bacteroidales bacterium]